VLQETQVNAAVVLFGNDDVETRPHERRRRDDSEKTSGQGDPGSPRQR
jgi:hypothetical protein